jgi:hypothetical protein
MDQIELLITALDCFILLFRWSVGLTSVFNEHGASFHLTPCVAELYKVSIDLRLGGEKELCFLTRFQKGLTCLLV